MQRATTLQNAPLDQAFQIGSDEHLIISGHDARNTHHWETVAAIAAEARSQGQAERVVDHTFVYVARYIDVPGLSLWLRSEESVASDDPCEHPARILLQSDGSGTVYSCRSSTALHLTSDLPRHVRPLLLYPLSADLLLDMLLGRLVVFVFVGLGKLVDTVHAIGCAANLPSGQEQFLHEFLSVTSNAKLPGGRTGTVTLTNGHLYGWEIMLEFLSLDGFLDRVELTVVAGASKLEEMSHEPE